MYLDSILKIIRLLRFYCALEPLQRSPTLFIVSPVSPRLPRSRRTDSTAAERNSSSFVPPNFRPPSTVRRPPSAVHRPPSAVRRLAVSCPRRVRPPLIFDHTPPPFSLFNSTSYSRRLASTHLPPFVTDA